MDEKEKKLLNEKNAFARATQRSKVQVEDTVKNWLNSRALGSISYCNLLEKKNKPKKLMFP